MLERSQFWILTAIGAVAFVLAPVNMTLFLVNRGQQAEAASRAQFIQESVALENLYREIVQALADRAARTRDEELRALLAAEGFNLSFDAPPAGAPQAEKPR
ncbi:MAG: hypothetical protein L6Q83_01915 [Gammaproteobacteria bacterium]|nr:hypothetical protein [Gammaproteobacteria bacterium]